MSSSHYQWVIDRVGETESFEGARIHRGVQELLDALRTLRGTGTKGVFGLSMGSLQITEEEKLDLQARIGAALLRRREQFEKEGDVSSLLDLSQFADLCNLPELRITKRFPLRCDPLGDASNLASEWQAIVSRLRAARDESAGAALRWDRVGTLLVDDQQAKRREVTFGEPNADALYQFALRYEQGHKQESFSRELAAIWSIADGIRIDDLWWYLSPVADWSWEDHGLQVGSGQSIQGSLCVAPSKKKGKGKGKAKSNNNLADAQVVDRDDDGTILQKYPSLHMLLELLLLP